MGLIPPYRSLFLNYLLYGKLLRGNYLFGIKQLLEQQKKLSRLTLDTQRFFLPSLSPNNSFRHNNQK